MLCIKVATRLDVVGLTVGWTLLHWVPQLHCAVISAGTKGGLASTRQRGALGSCQFCSHLHMSSGTQETRLG